MPNFNLVSLKCGLLASKITKIVNFWCKFSPKGYIPLSDFYKIWLGEGLPGPHPHAKFHHCGIENMGLQPPTSQKLVFIDTNFPQRGIPLSDIFTKFSVGRESQVPTLTPTFTIVALKCELTGPQNHQK